jgi:hypothetical protein
MFSLDKFYNILHDNLISQFPHGKSISFYPFGTYDFPCIQTSNEKHRDGVYATNFDFFHCYFADQEPYYESTTQILTSSKIPMFNPDSYCGLNKINILAISEHSDIIKQPYFYNWYYFFHGFAALDWYRDFQYLNPTSFNRFDKVFICYNHLTSNLRSYRLHLVSNLIEQDLVNHGYVSLFADEWQSTIQDPMNPLDNRARVKIYKQLKKTQLPLIVDTDNPSGTMSADVNFEDLTKALFHIVTETVYFDPKLHLTEKVFKPIVAKRPFFLVAAPGNLAYLKSYGFKTFDRWIDESYDEEIDHYIRIEKITAEIARLCAMDPIALEQMHLEMQEVLEYNFNYFYTTFKDLIIDELVDNFEHVLCQVNNGRQPNNHSRYHQRFELTPEYLAEVKSRLKQ